MKKPVTECSASIDDFGLVLVAQFSPGNGGDFADQKEAVLSMRAAVGASLRACKK